MHLALVLRQGQQRRHGLAQLDPLRAASPGRRRHGAGGQLLARPPPRPARAGAARHGCCARSTAATAAGPGRAASVRAPAIARTRPPAPDPRPGRRRASAPARSAAARRDAARRRNGCPSSHSCPVYARAGVLVPDCQQKGSPVGRAVSDPLEPIRYWAATAPDRLRTNTWDWKRSVDSVFWAVPSLSCSRTCRHHPGGRPQDRCQHPQCAVGVLGRSGNFVDFEIDLANEIGKRRGKSIEVVNIPLSGPSRDWMG